MNVGTVHNKWLECYCRIVHGASNIAWLYSLCNSSSSFQFVLQTSGAGMRAHDNATLKYSCWFILQATDGDQGHLVRRIVFLPNNIGEPAQARDYWLVLLVWNLFTVVFRILFSCFLSKVRTGPTREWTCFVGCKGEANLMWKDRTTCPATYP